MASTAPRDKFKKPQAPVGAEILDRLPPQNLDAEKGLIGSLMLDEDMCDEVALIIVADDFYADAHQKLFANIMEMHDSGNRIDVMLLIEKLTKSEELEAVGGKAYIAEIANAVPVAAHAAYYAKIVREKSTLRSLIHTGTDILRDSYDSTMEPEDLLSQAEQKIFAIRDNRTGDAVTNSTQLMTEAFDRINARLDGAEGGGVPTGFADLDNMTGGFHNAELLILAARPAMGKTALAMNMVEKVVLDANKPALFVSLEMARVELAQRLLCSNGRIDATKFRSGYLSKEDHDRLAETASRISQAPLFVDDAPSRTVTQISAAARRIKRKHGLSLIAIDYLQLLQPDDPRDPRQEQVAKMARRLKGMARELDVPVLCLSQLNRQTESQKGGDHRPKLSQLRESGAIEQDADVVMFIHREEYYHTHEESMEKGITGQGEIIIAKQRSGPTGDVKVGWFPKFTRFDNLAQPTHDEFSDFADPAPTEF